MLNVECVSTPSVPLRGGVDQEVGVVDGVVGPVDQEVLVVHAEPGRLGDVGGEGLDLVAGEHRDRGSVLGSDHDGARLAGPQVAVLLDQVVQPGRSGLGVVQGDRGGTELGGDVVETVLGQYHAGSDVRDVRVADGDQQHAGVAVGRAVAVGAVEGVVAGHPEGCALYPVDQLALLGVGRHGRRHAVEGLVERVAERAERCTATGHCHDDDNACH